MAEQPLTYQWNGEGMVPLKRFHNLANASFVVGGYYTLAEIEERSDASHKHEFAWLKTAWLTLPESIADQYPSPEHLRKRALIQGGYFTEQVIDVGSNAAALRVAAYARSEDEFAYVIVRGGFVVVRKAKSQSRRAMQGPEFQASKTKILEIIGDMIGVDPSDLSRARAA